MRFKAQKTGDTCERVKIALFGSEHSARQYAERCNERGTGEPWTFWTPARWRQVGYQGPNQWGIVEVQEEHRRVVPPRAVGEPVERPWEISRSSSRGYVVLSLKSDDGTWVSYVYEVMPIIQTVGMDLAYAGWSVSDRSRHLDQIYAGLQQAFGCR